MKRQVAITGPTPQFLRWSIAKACQLRADTDVLSVDETEKRLRAVRATGLAISEKRVFRGIAVGSERELQSKGYRISEILDPLGGESVVYESCRNCSINIDANADMLAGCFGWLSTTELPETFLTQVDEASRRVDLGDQFLSTNPVWYGLWAGGQLAGRQIETVNGLLAKAFPGQRSAELNRLMNALQACQESDCSISVESVPDGFSDGQSWIISAHCDQCKAPWNEGSRKCPVCGKAGQGHPPIRKKVLGLRPYVDLAVLMGPDNVAGFLKDYTADQQAQ